MTAAKERLSPNAFRALIIVRPREPRAASIGRRRRKAPGAHFEARFVFARTQTRAQLSLGCRCAEYSQADAIRSEYVHVYIHISMHLDIYVYIFVAAIHT